MGIEIGTKVTDKQHESTCRARGSIVYTGSTNFRLITFVFPHEMIITHKCRLLV